MWRRCGKGDRAEGEKRDLILIAWTLTHYEGRRLRLPASGQPTLAQHMERISTLPKPQQKFVIQMIEMALAQQGR